MGNFFEVDEGERESEIWNWIILRFYEFWEISRSGIARKNLEKEESWNMSSGDVVLEIEILKNATIGCHL